MEKEEKIPLAIVVEKSKKELIDFINKLCNQYHLSFFLLEIILKDIYEETRRKKEIEVEELEKIYKG